MFAEIGEEGDRGDIIQSLQSRVSTLPLLFHPPSKPAYARLAIADAGRPPNHVKTRDEAQDYKNSTRRDTAILNLTTRLLLTIRTPTGPWSPPPTLRLPSNSTTPPPAHRLWPLRLTSAPHLPTASEADKQGAHASAWACLPPSCPIPLKRGQETPKSPLSKHHAAPKPLRPGSASNLGCYPRPLGLSTKHHPKPISSRKQQAAGSRQ